MNVYQLRIDTAKSKVYGGGTALVAAPTFEAAKYEYICNGDYGEELYDGKLILTPNCDIAILGLHYDGITPQILVDDFFFD